MRIWTEVDSPDVLKELSSRLSKLRTLSFGQLKELPEFSRDSVQIGEAEVTFMTYREIEHNGNLEIVLQASIAQRDGLIMKRAQVSADGFRMTCNGEIQPLPKNALYFYM